MKLDEVYIPKTQIVVIPDTTLNAGQQVTYNALANGMYVPNPGMGAERKTLHFITNQ